MPAKKQKSPQELQIAIMKYTGIGQENATKTSEFKHLVNDSVGGGARKKLERALNDIEEFNVGAFEVTPTKPKTFYWLSEEAKRQALSKVLSVNMSLTQAVNYTVLDQNFGFLLPRVHNNEFALFFDVAKEMVLKKQKNDRAFRSLTDLIEITPLSVESSAPKFNKAFYETVLEAIVEKKVISADYDSVHSEIPGSIIFSPQKLRLDRNTMHAFGVLHNPLKGGYSIGRSHYVLYSKLNINKLKNVRLEETGPRLTYQYISEPQPTEQFTFTAYVKNWVKTELEQTTFLVNQAFEPIKDGSNLDNKFQKVLQQDHDNSMDSWSIVSGQIRLPQHFKAKVSSSSEESEIKYDAFALCNLLSSYGRDILVLEPSPVLEEMQLRLRDLAMHYLGSSSE